MRDIGKNIRDIRVSKNLTQDQLAELLFVTRQTVSNYENGRSRPDIDMVFRIADVLKTDVNSILYGLTIPENRRIAYKRLWIALGILIALIGIHVWVCVLKERDIFLYHSIFVASKLLVLPIAVSILGWIVMHTLSIFCNLKQLRERLRRACRIVLWIIVGFLSVMLLPHIVFEIIVFIRSFTTNSVNMSLHIPIVNQIAVFVFRVTYNLPYLYALLGGLFWLAGVPKARKLTDDCK